MTHAFYQAEKAFGIVTIPVNNAVAATRAVDISAEVAENS
jgi:hypothetical protein